MCRGICVSRWICVGVYVCESVFVWGCILEGLYMWGVYVWEVYTCGGVYMSGWICVWVYLCVCFMWRCIHVGVYMCGGIYMWEGAFQQPPTFYFWLCSVYHVGCISQLTEGSDWTALEWWGTAAGSSISLLLLLPADWIRFSWMMEQQRYQVWGRSVLQIHDNLHLASEDAALFLLSLVLLVKEQISVCTNKCIENNVVPCFSHEIHWCICQRSVEKEVNSNFTQRPSPLMLQLGL